jgi:hypothetical protein
MIRVMTFSGFVFFGLTTYAIGQTVPPMITGLQMDVGMKTEALKKSVPELVKQCAKCSDDDKRAIMAALKRAVDAVETMKKETNSGFAELEKLCKKK